MPKYHWETGPHGKRRLVFDPLPPDFLSNTDIPWEAIKNAIRALTGYGFTALRKADIEDVARCELDNWKEIKKVLLAAGAHQEGQYLVFGTDFDYSKVGDEW